MLFEEIIDDGWTDVPTKGVSGLLGHEPAMIYLPPSGFLYTIIFLKPSVLEVFFSMLALWRLESYAVTACYKRYSSELNIK